MLLCKEDNSIYSWLAKLKKNQVNSDALLLIFNIDSRNDQNIDIKLNEIKDRITEELTTQEIFHYEILTIDNITSVKVDTNTILIGYKCMDGKLLQNINFQILFCYCRNYDRETIFPVDKKKIIWDKYTDESYSTIKKRDPVEVIFNYKAYQMKNYLYSYFIQILLNKNITIFCQNIFNQWLREDIIVLGEKKVLTARLAIIIYKVSTLNFNASDTKIGFYYKNAFGIKSKSMRLNIHTKTFFKVYCIGEWLDSKVQLTSD